MIKVYYCFKPFEDTSQVCYHTVDLLIFFYTHRKDRNLLFMTETYHIPFIGHYILIRSYCFHFGSSVSSPVLLLPIQFLCFKALCIIGIVWMNPFVGRVKKQRTGNNMVRCRTVTTENYISTPASRVSAFTSVSCGCNVIGSVKKNK